MYKKRLRKMLKKIMQIKEKYMLRPLHQEFKDMLLQLDAKIPDLDPKGLQKEFERIPLEVFGRIQIERPPEFPNFLHWIPTMPSAKDQEIWTAASDHVLMGQSVNFIKTVVSHYHAITCKPVSQANVLDFGCGWGRLIRLLYKYVPSDHIYGIDPWDKSIEICKENGIHANLFVSDFIPRTLPTPTDVKFDFIFAFSVFSHLSEKVTKISAETFKNHLTSDGLVAITIRPKEFWDFRSRNKLGISPDEARRLSEQHDQQGFAFRPHNRSKIEGEVTYGDTSMSLDYIRRNFTGLEIVGLEWSEVDWLQLIVFLKKTGE